jgi:hypothetical protein
MVGRLLAKTPGISGTSLTLAATSTRAPAGFQFEVPAREEAAATWAEKLRVGTADGKRQQQ